MTRGERLAASILLGAAVVASGTACAAAYAWHHAGTFRIAVQDDGPDGTNFSMTLPGALVDAAIAAFPVPNHLDLDGEDAVFRDLVPALHAVRAQLDDLPDAVLVDIRDGAETVRVAKHDDTIQIRVASPGERVAIDLPIRSLCHALSKLERVARSHSPMVS
jgi:hypothetical protein